MRYCLWGTPSWSNRAKILAPDRGFVSDWSVVRQYEINHGLRRNVSISARYCCAPNACARLSVSAMRSPAPSSVASSVGQVGIAQETSQSLPSPFVENIQFTTAIGLRM